MTRPDPGRAPRRSRLLAALAAIVAMSVCCTIGPAAAALSWSVLASPAVSGAGSELDGVSCATASSCVAVGYRLTGAGIRQTLAEVASGTSWTVATTPNRGTRSNRLAGVACPSATSCFAVGGADNGTAMTTLVEHWDGTTWTVTTSPNQGTSGSELLAVSCATASSCFAVGYSADSAGNLHTLVEAWNGTTWTVTSSPSPNSAAILNGVSCAGATACVAVGDTLSSMGSQRTLVESWNGASWTVTPSPSPASNTVLNGVSCRTATNCVAVGWAAELGRRTLVEVWSGGTWSVASSPNTAAKTNYLRSVSCPTITNCVAVGLSDDGTVIHTLVETSTESGWALSTAPNPGSVESELLAASCATYTTCVTGGRASSTTVPHALLVGGSGPADVASPSVSLTTPVDGGYYVVGQSTPAVYSCLDNTGGSGIASCSGNVPAGSPIATSAPGAAAFSVLATDAAGKTATASAHYTVVAPASASTVLGAGGGSVTTDPGGGPTALDPVTTTISGVNAGTTSIDQDAVTLAPPSGFSVLGMQIDTVAPAATRSAPLHLTVDVDAAMLPAGANAGNVSVLEDGALLSDCPGATTVPSLDDACVSGRATAPSGGGDIRLSVLATRGAQWDIATGTPVAPGISIANAAIHEGNTGTSTLSLPVSLSKPSALPVSVHYATADGSAKAGSDYVAASGTLTLAPGQAHATVPVTINGDTTREPDQVFTVTLSSPAGATIVGAVGTGTIDDDDVVAPSAPLSVSATPGNASATLRWKRPTDTGGRVIGGYVVIPYAGAVALAPRNITTPALAAVITGLANGTTYGFTVAAVNAIGTGTASPRTSGVTVGGPLAPVLAAVGSSGAASLSWQPPANNGWAVTSYLVSVYDGSVLVAGKTHTVTCAQPCTPSTTWKVTGLTNGKEYTFGVTATNAQGTGHQGRTTILVSGTPKTPGKPGTPSAGAFSGGANVSWFAPPAGTASIDRYLVTTFRNGVQTGPVVVALVPNYVFRGLSPGQKYAFQVQASNVNGAGPKSAKSAAVTP